VRWQSAGSFVVLYDDLPHEGAQGGWFCPPLKMSHIETDLASPFIAFYCAALKPLNGQFPLIFIQTSRFGRAIISSTGMWVIHLDYFPWITCWFVPRPASTVVDQIGARTRDLLVSSQTTIRHKRSRGSAKSVPRPSVPARDETY
jgi:hypothetical protein